MRKVPGGVYDKWNMSVNNNLHVSTLIECMNMNTNKLNKEKRDAIIRKFY